MASKPVFQRMSYDNARRFRTWHTAACRAGRTVEKQKRAGRRSSVLRLLPGAPDAFSTASPLTSRIHASESDSEPRPVTSRPATAPARGWAATSDTPLAKSADREGGPGGRRNHLPAASTRRAASRLTATDDQCLTDMFIAGEEIFISLRRLWLIPWTALQSLR